MNEDIARDFVRISKRVFALVVPELRGLPYVLQSAILADLTSLWLAAHIVPGDDEAATDKIREKVLAMHIDLVRKLLPANDALFRSE